MVLGICDDQEKWRKEIYSLCEVFFEEEYYAHEYVFFSKAEEIIEYCKDDNNQRIDLLFLDIKMDGMDGIELKNATIKEKKIWRIVFVSSYTDNMSVSFGLKTIGFEEKPLKRENASKWLKYIVEELKRDKIAILKDGNKDIYVAVEEIVYIKAEGNYVILFLNSSDKDRGDRLILRNRLSDIEEQLREFDIIRVHKSYIVNLQNVLRVEDEVRMRHSETNIPIGRIYKERVNEAYHKYIIKMLERR